MGTDWDSMLNIQYDSGSIAEFLKATPGVWHSNTTNVKPSDITFSGNSLTFDGDTLTFDQG